MGNYTEMRVSVSTRVSMTCHCGYGPCGCVVTIMRRVGGTRMGGDAVLSSWLS